MNRLRISEILESKADLLNKEVLVRAWVRTFRNDKFITLNDGSTIDNIQVVVDGEADYKEILKKISPGASIEVKGLLIPSQGKGQDVEMKADSVVVLGESNANEYLLQSKRHSLDFLRSNLHLRMKTNTFGAVMRVRHTLSYAVHKYFHTKGFYYLHTPIITSSDCEGAGEMFNVSTFSPNKAPVDEQGEVDYKKDFFGKKTSLTVSGQLQAEIGAMALGQVYTFGPTFRSENSNTSRHLSEFWMIEPEVAFNDLTDNMDLAEDFIKYVIRYTVENCQKDIEFLDKRHSDEQKSLSKERRGKLGLIESLNYVLDKKFIRVSYTEAIDILLKSSPNKKKKFNYLIDKWGVDLQSEHERFLVEQHFDSPVAVYDYPKDIKAFYMRLNDDKKTVRAMDILFPGIGEMVGGSQREERLDLLIDAMKSFGISQKELWWYLDTRKFGTVVHSGFGLGFDRLVSFVTGMSNIRDVIPFPRTPKNADF
ncbi:asparagine--tRNA ligase [Ichthyobacterium seriolicida]|uniref:Asparagine--tRNA ligase n=1 Tax=Ichthyobacterium seriolicida TaxID=242600 RepID=A0A1J1DZP6_9FLAO|nr:asparagine--tRNA ligase [Ichthyobacterium seriolicida]BAV95394.1 asparaginyl-tRNA synthetase [Ichthyobacterium seriolicida]